MCVCVCVCVCDFVWFQLRRVRAVYIARVLTFVSHGEIHIYKGWAK